MNIITDLCDKTLQALTLLYPGGNKNDPSSKEGSKLVGECACAKSQSIIKSQNSTQLLSCSGRNMVRLAGISGALAVGLGAYGAHVVMMDDSVPEEQKYSYRTGNLYHFFGTFGLVASALSRKPLLTGALMMTGTVLFCGSCYAHGLTGNSSVKKFAPFGGTTLIIAWLSFLL